MVPMFSVLVSAALAFGPIAQDPTPPKPVEKPVQEKKPDIYDEKADATQQIAAALARARKENRRVLIQWGGNWCGWCHLLHELCAKNKELGKKLLYEYDVVRVDVGHFDKHMDVAEKYGADLRKNGLPFLTILDAQGKVLANQETSSLEATIDGKPGHDPKLVLELLTAHQAPYLKAGEVYAAAMARAKEEDKRVFLHFGAPWCGWCHRLEDWMAKPEIAAILSKEFVDVKIDIDRMLGGPELQARYPRSTKLGIPWFVFLGADGAELADSTDAEGKNTGFPYEEKEIAHFRTMLEKAAKKLTPEDINRLASSLTANRENQKL
jgi:thiol-disulfide isomerase/thioredoxin